MMQVLRADDHFLLRPTRGEEILHCVQEFARDEGFEHATISGIGAVDEAELGAYSVETGEYTRRDFPDAYEVAALIANLSWVDGEPYCHAHVVLSDHDFRCFGGHLFRARVYATVELVVRPGRGRVERRMDDEIGLRLLHLPEHCAYESS